MRRCSTRTSPASRTTTSIARDERAPWWYLTSPAPPTGRLSMTSSPGRPSNSAMIDV